MKKEGTDDAESLCDYLLTVGSKEQIIFGEIKTKRKSWASEGAKQIKQTILIFRANHNLSEWRKCRAYVSNYRRWKARNTHHSVKENFKIETGGIRLYIQNDVHIDGEE